MTVEEYKQRLAARLIEQAPTLESFRERWVAPDERRRLLQSLPGGSQSARVVREIEGLGDYDLYDVLADLAYGLQPHTRLERAGAFTYKQQEWLNAMPKPAAATVRALASQFARGGTEDLENPRIFQTPEVVQAGGLNALKAIGTPRDVLQETKARMFAA